MSIDGNTRWIIFNIAWNTLIIGTIIGMSVYTILGLNVPWWLSTLGFVVVLLSSVMLIALCQIK